MSSENRDYVVVGRSRKRKTVFTRFISSKSNEFSYIKRPMGAVFGALMGFGYFKMTFATSFRESERIIGLCVFWSIMFLSSFGCALSVQCRSIAALCIPTMVGKTGKSVLHALVATWILLGPVTNVVYHGGESIRSITCVARMQSKQMTQFMHILHAPVTAGLKQLVDDAKILNDTEEMLKSNMDGLKADLWTNRENLQKRDVSYHVFDTEHHRKMNKREDKSKQTSNGHPDNKHIDFMKIFAKFGKASRRRDVRDTSSVMEETGDIATKLHDDAHGRCIDLFTYGVEECKRLIRKKEQDCHDTIKIPILKDLLCLVMKATFVCNIVSYFDSWCNELPELDKSEINRNYSDMGHISHSLNDEFETGINWKVPKLNEDTGVMTVEEIVDQVETDLQNKQDIFNFIMAFVQKIVAISFIFVLTAASSYNTKYLTDFRFDNLYVTTYFVRKDKERRMRGKRCLLPLTKMEQRNVIYPKSLKLCSAEKKSIAFKLLKLFAEILFTAVIFLFDYVIYFILELIRRHAKVDVTISGRHKLEVKIEGEKTVATLLKRLFLPFKDNEHVAESSTSNLVCLPKVHKLSNDHIWWICGMYTAIIVATLLDAYALRLRHVIAGLAYHRREKKRVIFFYSDLMRRRKHHLHHVRMNVAKLARNYRLQQRYSFMQAIKYSYPIFTACFNKLGIGSSRCLICNDKETVTYKLIQCDEPKCRIRYCVVCWEEVGSSCWACKQYQPTEDEIQMRDEAHMEEEEDY